MDSVKLVLLLIVSAAAAVAATEKTGFKAEMAWMRTKVAFIHDITSHSHKGISMKYVRAQEGN